MKQSWVTVALSVALLVACDGGRRSDVSASAPLNGPASGSASASDGIASAECKTMNMRSLTGWKDPVTVVELEATTLTGKKMYAWGIGDAVWIASTNSPDRGALILPVNKAARRYDPVTGAGQDTFQAGYLNAALESKGALADCG